MLAKLALKTSFTSLANDKIKVEPHIMINLAIVIKPTSQSPVARKYVYLRSSVISLLNKRIRLKHNVSNEVLLLNIEVLVASPQ